MGCIQSSATAGAIIVDDDNVVNGGGSLRQLEWGNKVIVRYATSSIVVLRWFKVVIWTVVTGRISRTIGTTGKFTTKQEGENITLCG